MWSDGAVNHFTPSLKDWMIDRHVINLGMLMKPMLQALDYIFWPGRGEGEVNHAAGRAANLYLHHFDTPAPYPA